MCPRRWFSLWALSWCQTFCGWIEGAWDFRAPHLFLPHCTRTDRLGLLTLSTWSIARCCLVCIYIPPPIPREPDGDCSRSSDLVPGHTWQLNSTVISMLFFFVPVVFFCFCHLGWSPKHMREWRRTHVCSTDPFQDCGEPQISISFAQQKIERRE